MIYIVLESLPPSSNQAYFNRPGGGRSLTGAGKAYKAEVTNHIIKHHATETKQLKKDCAVGTLVAFGFPNMLTKNWPDKAKNRFQKLDIDNRVKLLQDAIKDATSIDDSQICFDFKYKFHSTEPQTVVYLWNEDAEPIGHRLLNAFASVIGSTGKV